MGVIYALLSAVLYATLFFITKLLVMKTKEHLIPAFLFQFASGFIFLLFFINEPFYAEFTFKSVVLTILVTFLYSAFNIFGFWSNKYLDFSIIGILSQLPIVIALIGGVLIFNEDLTQFKLIGAALIILGNILIMLKRIEIKDNFLLGVLLRTIASVSLGLAVLIDGVNIHYFSIPLYGFLTFFVPGIWTYTFSRAKFVDIQAFFMSHYKVVMLMGLMGSFGYYFLLKSFQLLDKSIAIPINNSYSVIMLILGVVILKESDQLAKKIIAMILVFLGVIFLANS